jgi:predicted NAD-dependent protein-ADP-ribosyltransferase YbiA (DUF1768 family)
MSTPRLNVSLDTETMSKFRELCKLKKISLSTGIRKLVEEAVKKQEIYNFDSENNLIK